MGVLSDFENSMQFLAEWLHDNGSPPINYRLHTEFQGLSTDDSHVKRLKKDLYEYAPAQEILDKQKPDGTWGSTFRGSMLGARIGEDSLYSGIECQFARLLEMGFNNEDEPVQKCARMLKLYLEDNPRVPLYEAKIYQGKDPEAVQWYLRLLKVISAKLLSIAGYSKEKYLKKWLVDYANNLNEYLESDGSSSPYSKHNDRYIIHEEIMMPGVHLLDLLAFNKWLRDGLLGNLLLPKLFRYLENFPPPPEDCPVVRYSSLNWEFPDIYLKAGNTFHRGLGIPSPITREELTTKYKGRIPAVLRHLEMRARMGWLDRDDPVLLWLLSHQDRRGVIHIPGRIYKQVAMDTYHYFPLHDDFKGQGRDVDTTFRTFLIVHNLRRTPKVKY